MKISQIISENAGTTAGAVAPVSQSFVKMQSRNPVVSSKKGNNLLTGTKTKKPYMNSLHEGKMKELAMDLRNDSDGLNDANFLKKYGKTKQEMRKAMAKQPKPNKPNEKVEEAKLDEEDKIISPDKGSKLKTGLHGKDAQPKMLNLIPPFKSQGIWVSDKRGKSVCECTSNELAPIVAKALNHYASTNESVVPGGTIAGGIAGESVSEIEEAGFVSPFAKIAKLKAQYEKILSSPNPNVDRLRRIREQIIKLEHDMGLKEGVKVDRMVQHVKSSEKKLGKSDKEAENIAWATANKRGMLDNKNKKKGK